MPQSGQRIGAVENISQWAYLARTFSGFNGFIGLNGFMGLSFGTRPPRS